MKLQERHYLTSVFANPKMVDQVLDNFKGSYDSMVEKGSEKLPPERMWYGLLQFTLLGKSEIFNDKVEVQEYLLTETALKVIEKIKVEPDFDLKFLKTTKSKVYGLWINEFEGYRVFWGPNSVFILQAVRLPEHIARQHGTAMEASISAQYVGSHHDMRKLIKADFTMAQFVIRSLLFLELSEPTLQLIPAGKKVGTKKSGHYNETRSNLTVVTSKWNTVILRTEGFGVSGHFRPQWCGVGRKDKKLIYIKPYEKQGYKRLAGSGKKLTTDA